MYDELVKAIRQNTCHFDACGMCPKRNALCLDRIALQAADAIEELSAICEEQKAQIITMAAEEKPRWIPVTERLPREFGRYLCRYRVEEGETIGYCTDFGRYDPEHGEWFVGTVTHWMPLPPAPKEESYGV